MKKPKAITLNRLAAIRSLLAAVDGEFELLSERLSSGAALYRDERAFLADLLSERLDFKVARKDGRVRTRRHARRRKEIADFVQSQIDVGRSLEEAFILAGEKFRTGKGEWPSNMREAYREHYPLGEQWAELEREVSR